jgi:3-dehydroquinate dehydratase-2
MRRGRRHWTEAGRVPADAAGEVVSDDERQASSMVSVLVLNGPNLNLLGTRKPEVYGSTTLADVEELCRQEAGKLGLDVVFRQSNWEGQIIDWIHEAGAAVKAGESIGAVYNPGAHTHTSVAIRDAIEGASLPVIECHISNVHAREEFRHHSYISPVARGVIIGFGVLGYPLAIQGLHRLRHPEG